MRLFWCRPVAPTAAASMKQSRKSSPNSCPARTRPGSRQNGRMTAEYSASAQIAWAKRPILPGLLVLQAGPRYYLAHIDRPGHRVVIVGRDLQEPEALIERRGLRHRRQGIKLHLRITELFCRSDDGGHQGCSDALATGRRAHI